MARQPDLFGDPGHEATAERMRLSDDQSLFIDRGGMFVWGDDGQARVNFGKHLGARLADVPTGYLRWMAGDTPAGRKFPAEVTVIAANALKRMYPRRPAPPPEELDIGELT